MQRHGSGAAPWALGVRGLVDLGVSIAQFDGDVPLQLILEADSLHPGDGLHQCGLAMCHMTYGACTSAAVSSAPE